MTAGTDALSYFLSAGGLIVIVVLVAVWMLVVPASTRARRVLVAVAMAFAFLSIYGAQHLVARILTWPFTPFQASKIDVTGRTAIVLLGSGSIDASDWDGQIHSFVDRHAAIRVTEAVRVFRRVDPAFVISSGGEPSARRRGAPTGETMKDALLAAGVPAERILVETQSKTTRDEALVVAPMLEARGVTQVILVTSGVHMRRALGAFRAAGVRAVPAIAREFDPDLNPAPVFLPSREGLGVAEQNAHEVAGLVYYWLRGWWTR